MKELFKIFVEGDADKRFISQLLEFLFKTSIDQGNIIKTSGWNCLVSPKTEEVYVNQMNRTSADGGVNLVIFDADADFEDRKKKLSCGKNAVMWISSYSYFQTIKIQENWKIC